jgi:septum formation topological specificity factor MinE
MIKRHTTIENDKTTAKKKKQKWVSINNEKIKLRKRKEKRAT